MLNDSVSIINPFYRLRDQENVKDLPLAPQLRSVRARIQADRLQTPGSLQYTILRL